MKVGFQAENHAVPLDVEADLTAAEAAIKIVVDAVRLQPSAAAVAHIIARFRVDHAYATAVPAIAAVDADVEAGPSIGWRRICGFRDDRRTEICSLR